MEPHHAPEAPRRGHAQRCEGAGAAGRRRHLPPSLADEVDQDCRHLGGARMAAHRQRLQHPLAFENKEIRRVPSFRQDMFRRRDCGAFDTVLGQDYPNTGVPVLVSVCQGLGFVK